MTGVFLRCDDCGTDYVPQAGRPFWEAKYHWSRKQQLLTEAVSDGWVCGTRDGMRTGQYGKDRCPACVAKLEQGQAGKPNAVEAP